MTICERCGESNPAEIHTCTPDFSKAGFGKPQREEGCAGCEKKASDGWALYCVKCTEREWVGLTDEEITEAYAGGMHVLFGDANKGFARAIESKLREKNT